MAMATLAPAFTPFASSDGRRRVNGSPSSSSRRRPKQQKLSVADVQRAIGLADDDDPLRMRANSSSGSPSPSFLDLLSSTPIGQPEGPAERKLREVAEWVVDQTEANARAGQQILMDLHLAIEIFIEAFFDMVHKAAHFLLSPTEIYNKLFGWISNHGSSQKDVYDSDNDVAVPTAMLGDADPTPTERQTTFHHSLNTNARKLRYPYEAVRVVTSDGYVLLLERIPRHDSQKAVYLQHGILDSSMGWVSNGVIGSPAFAAYDQGYDVFLGNLRGLVSREHIDNNISSRKYW